MKLAIFVSTIADGSMKSLTGDFREAQDARTQFLNKNEIQVDQTTLLQVVYEGEDYRRYKTVGGVDGGDGITRPASIVSDALLTRDADHALLLPIADCAPLVIFDETTGAMMLSHLGRQSVEQDGGRGSVEYFIRETGASLPSLKVWLGPAAGAENYPVWAMENRGLHEIILEQLKGVGVSSGQVEEMLIDVTKDPQYYSHSNFLKGLQDDIGDGRFAVVAVTQD